MKDKKEKKKKVIEKKTKKFNFVAKNIPTDSGCYLFYDEKSVLLYVGKAKDLRKRVKSYFQKTKKSPKTKLMVSKIFKIETRITNSEVESLILENNLIKEFRPKFNILLRDDKSFLYLRITKEDFPKLEITRRIVKDGSFYVGPKTSAKSFRKTIAFCQKVFRVRDCRLQLVVDNKELTILKNPETRKIPCMDYHIKKCSGPCSGEISIEDYQKDVSAMKKFLRGDTKGVLVGLREKMMNFAKDQNFEAAGKIRDLISSIETSTEKQVVQLDSSFEADFIHFYRQNKLAYFVRVLFRNGKFLDQNIVKFSSPAIATDEEMLEKFLIQFYEKVDVVPKNIYIPLEIENKNGVLKFFGAEDANIQIKIPQKGDKKKILDIAFKNARNEAKKAEIATMSQAENFAKALPNLAKILDLKNPPKRIECYDVSHFSGGFPVASQVVFVDGKPKKSEYRRYHIKSLEKGKVDDFAAMEEVLGRRFAFDKSPKLPLSDGLDGDVDKESKKKTKKKKETDKFTKNLPDLVVIDGGKGQLSSVMKVFKKLKIKKFDSKTQIISLAKREEQIFRPEVKEPMELDWDEPALKLLQRLRDEAHRFAISFNRSLRQKNATKSVLDEISGIGGVTKKKLMARFESVSGIAKASDEELLEVLNEKQLISLRKFL